MSDFVRFHGSGRVNQVQDMSTIKGKPFARLWLGIGGDATKSESVVRVDFYGEDERAQVLALRRGQRALVSSVSLPITLPMHLKSSLSVGVITPYD